MNDGSFFISRQPFHVSMQLRGPVPDILQAVSALDAGWQSLALVGYAYVQRRRRNSDSNLQMSAIGMPYCVVDRLFGN